MFIKQSFSLFLFQIATDEVLHPVDFEFCLFKFDLVGVVVHPGDLSSVRRQGSLAEREDRPRRSIQFVKLGHDTDVIVERFSALCTDRGCFSCGGWFSCSFVFSFWSVWSAHVHPTVVSCRCILNDSFTYPVSST